MCEHSHRDEHIDCLRRPDSHRYGHLRQPICSLFGYTHRYGHLRDPICSLSVSVLKPHDCKDFQQRLVCSSFYTLTNLTCIMALFTSGAEATGRKNQLPYLPYPTVQHIGCHRRPVIVLKPHDCKYFQQCLVCSSSYTLTHLTCIMALFTSGAEAAGRQNENLFCDCVDLPHALVVVDHGHLGLTDPQGNWTS